jgi:hypothetical protein
MDKRQALALLRVGFAALAVVAILVQMLDLAGKGVLNPVNFFSYFTIQSNLIAVAALLVAAATWRGSRSAGRRVDGRSGRGGDVEDTRRDVGAVRAPPQPGDHRQDGRDTGRDQRRPVYLRAGGWPRVAGAGAAISGSADEIANAIRSFRDAGFTRLEIMMNPGTIAALEALAPVVEQVHAD